MEFNATFLISAISFILFTIIMNKIFYKPLENIMNERQKFINDNKLDAKNSSKRAEILLKDRENRLNKSVEESKKLVADKVNKANENSNNLISKAKQKSTEDIISAKNELSIQAAEAENELNSKVQALAEVISSKLLGQDVKINAERS